MVSVVLEDSSREDNISYIDIEVPSKSARPYIVYNAIYVSVTLAALLVFIRFGIKIIIIEAIGDGGYIRFVLILLIPF